MYSGKSGCIWAKVVLVGQNGFNLEKNCFNRAKWLYSGKSGCYRAKVVEFGKSGCVRV